MWLLPRLASGPRSWMLPLCEPTAGKLARALLTIDPVARQQQLITILKADAGLTLWALCRMPAARRSPTRWSALAEWLSSCAGVELTPLEPATCDAGEIGRHRCLGIASGVPCSPSNGNGDDGDELAVAEMRRLIGNAGQRFSDAGPEITTLELRTQTDWFPHWLDDGVASPIPAGAGNSDEAVPDVVGRHGDPSDAADGALSKLLPGVLRLLRPQESWHSEFAATRERDKLDALRQFAYGASHEINNPLANISTRAQALMRDEANPERRRRLGTIVSQAFRAHEMITDLMLFANPPPPRPSTWDAAALLVELARECSTDAAEQETLLQLSAAPGVVITADRTQIAVALKALIRNALEALTSGGRVELSLRHTEPEGEKPCLTISVRDNGPGILPHVRPHLFDPFFSGREAGRGLGFGLPKCWRIAALHGGRVIVDSEPGHGATFSLVLPIT